jgi:hypothetical protein
LTIVGYKGNQGRRSARGTFTRTQGIILCTWY